MDFYQVSLELCEKYRGKLEVVSSVPVTNKDELSTAYTPGVAEPCRRIHDDPNEAYRYTIKGHTVAVVTDGTAVLGLGDIGPEAALPVMEGKCLLFKTFGGVDAFPICLATKDVDEIVETVKRIAPAFGGINLEDISAPRCFEIEERLKRELDIPVFHDDQHGTAVVTLAGLINALKLVGKRFEDIRVVIGGAGSAGIAICKLLMNMNPRDIILTARRGALCAGEEWMNPAQRDIAQITNNARRRGTLMDVIEGADVFIGVSAPNTLTRAHVERMAKDAVIFAMANPVPEIMPEEAYAGGARVVATGRSDYPNQINNVLVFPGIFKGALESRARDITEDMKMAAAHAIAELVEPDKLSSEYIVPDPFDARVARSVARAVAEAARRANT